MRNFGSTNPHGTAFSPKQWLYQKEAKDMESPNIYCPTRCRHRTHHCVEANYPVSCGILEGLDWKYAKLGPYQSPWYRVSTRAMVISKGSYGHRKSKNGLANSVQTPYLPLRGNKLPRFMGGIGPRMKICGNSGLHIPLVPAPKEWLYEKEATGMESSKIYCPSLCRYRTD